MARLVTSSFELNSLTSGVEVDGTITGSPTIVTSPVHTGTYALQCTTSAAQAYIRYNPYTSNTSNKIYVRAWINISSYPASGGTADIIGIYTSSITALAKLKLTSTGTLTTINSTNGTIGTASAALSTGTWYCVEFYLDSSVNNGTVEGRLNGTLFTSAAGNATAGAARVLVGIFNTTTATINFDDIAVNDNTGSSQTGYPGLGQIVRATPNAAGDSNGFATAVGGTAGAANNYTRVNETTPDGTSTYNASNTLNASDLFGISLPAIPTGSIINCVVVGGQCANITAADATTAFKWQIEKTSGGTISKSAAIIPNSTTMTVNKGQPGASTYLHTLYNDPDGNPWTPATVASMQVGYTLSAAHTNPVAISTVWALVDYTLPLNNSGFFGFF